jgi:hypothetical protein
VQETFLRAWAACRSFDPSAGPSLATWLGTIGRNVAVDMLRARSVRPRLAAEADDRDERTGTTEDVDAALQRIVLIDALSQVSPEHRGVVLLAVVRDRPYADVAVRTRHPGGHGEEPRAPRPARHAPQPGPPQPRSSASRSPDARSALPRSNRAGGVTVYSCDGLHTPVHQEEK